ncbi:MAG: helix-turn-helix domain-containing protein [Caldilineales bacterium]|nr:helix-turn-helix domain-containing protein [Caldilineales bacterium]MDW8316652.1 helix-turn-helix domain-containing protein [Anaerolineae bacterium]
MLSSSPYQTSPQQIAQWLEAGPSETLAFLPETASPRRLAETLVALANGHGGALVLGVSSGGRLSGLASPREAQDRAIAAALMADPPLVLPLPEVVSVDGVAVCVVHVPPGLPHAYSLKGQYLTRTGSENRPLTTPELRSLLMARGSVSFESLPVHEATREDLDDAQVAQYMERLSGLTATSLSAALLTRGCLKPAEPGRFVPTYAGLLLFGRNPQQFLPSAEIIAVRYAGATMGDEFVREDIRGTLPQQIRRAEAFIAANMRRGWRIRSFEREEVTEYPLAVAREAVVNAVAHRDYGVRGDSIRLLMFSNRMEVYSPGRLPGHVTLDNLVTERFSRNEVIVQVLSDLGFIERLGYGIDRMIAAMQEAGLPAPRFEETANGFRVTLYGHGEALVSAKPEAQRWGNVMLNPRQEQALAYVLEHGRITNSAFQALCPDVSPETIRRDLADLVEKDLLIKIGEKRATYYILK